MIVNVGSKNKAKLSAVEQALRVLFPNSSPVVKGFSVASGVPDQPMTDEQAMLGAKNRAAAALRAGGDDLADFGVGLEGGVQQINGQWFESGWIAVMDKHGHLGVGTSARYELSAKIMDRIFKGQELGDVIDDLSGQSDVRSNAGAMGILTNGILNRDICYMHGLYFAFAPFISHEKYWK